jgi:hypothetical protein
LIIRKPVVSMEKKIEKKTEKKSKSKLLADESTER